MKGLRKTKELRFLDVALQLSLYWNREINRPIPSFTNALGLLCYNFVFNKLNPYFPDALRYLCWNDYPFSSLPKIFQANNLVVVQMLDSKIVKLWEGGERKVVY